MIYNSNNIHYSNSISFQLYIVNKHMRSLYQQHQIYYHSNIIWSAQTVPVYPNNSLKVEMILHYIIFLIPPPPIPLEI